MEETAEHEGNTQIHVHFSEVYKVIYITEIDLQCSSTQGISTNNYSKRQALTSHYKEEKVMHTGAEGELLWRSGKKAT